VVRFATPWIKATHVPASQRCKPGHSASLEQTWYASAIRGIANSPTIAAPMPPANAASSARRVRAVAIERAIESKLEVFIFVSGKIIG
jgi:hypothetical protein